jgi:hypothetical protein
MTVAARFGLMVAGGGLALGLAVGLALAVHDRGAERPAAAPAASPSACASCDARHARLAERRGELRDAGE